MAVYLDKELSIIIEKMKSNGSLNPWEMLDHVYAACELARISLPVKMTGNPGKAVVDNLNYKTVEDLISQLGGRVYNYASGNHLHWMKQRFFHDKAVGYVIRCAEEIATSIRNSAASISRQDRDVSKAQLDDAFCQAVSLIRGVRQLRNIVNRNFIAETEDFMEWIMMHVSASWVLIDGIRDVK